MLTNKVITFLDELKLSFCKNWIKDFLLLYRYDNLIITLSKLLNKLNVKNKILNISGKKLHLLPTPFLLILKNNQFLIIRKVVNQKLIILSSNGNQNEVYLEEISPLWSGKTIIVQKEKKSGQADYKSYKWNIIVNSIINFILFAFFIGLFNLLSYYFLSTSFPLFLLFLTKIAGLTIALFLVMKQMGSNNEFIDSVCSINNKSSCSLVLDSKAGQILGIKMSDIGFVYFLFGLILILISLFSIQNSILFILGFLSYLSIIYTPFSLLYQGFILKKWCPLCVLIMIILGLEFLISLHFNLLGEEILYRSLYIYFVIFMVISLMWYRLKSSLKKLFIFKEQEASLTFFEENEFIQKSLINSSTKVLNSIPEGLLSKGLNDKRLTLIINLSCSKCGVIFNKIYDYTNLSKKSSIQLNLIFLADSKENMEVKKVALIIISIYSNNKILAFKSIYDWYKMKNLEDWKNKYDSIFKINDKVVNKLDTFKSFCKRNNINSSPSIIWKEKVVPNYFARKDKIDKLYFWT